MGVGSELGFGICLEIWELEEKIIQWDLFSKYPAIETTSLLHASFRLSLPVSCTCSTVGHGGLFSLLKPCIGIEIIVSPIHEPNTVSFIFSSFWPS